jgi:hypothetical protein
MAKGRFWLGEERDVMNVVRWFQSRFDFLDGLSEMPTVRSIFGHRSGGDEILSIDEGIPELLSVKLAANDTEAPNFVLPNQDESEPTGQLLYGDIKTFNYFAKPIDSGDVHTETLGLAGSGPFGTPGFQTFKSLDSTFGADSAPMGLLDGPPLDMLGAPPVI